MNYTYNALDRLAKTAYPDGSAESLTGACPRAGRRRDPRDANGNVLSRKTRNGDTLAFAYDTLNRVASKTAPGEAPVTYAYDLAGRLIAVSDTSAAVKTPAAPASYTASTTYDPLNRPLQVGWSPAAAQTAPTAASATFGFSYDATNRRIGETASDKSWWSYPTTAGTTPYTANNFNQYSAVGSVTPTYDQNGNLGYDGVFTYGYDAESRLTSIKQGANTVATYAWDAQGRRKSKTVGAATTMFVTDADNREVLEYDGTSGALQRWYAFGQGPDAVLNQMNVAAGTRETMIPDIQGSIVGLLDSGSGTLTKSGYQPFGENPSLTGGTFRWTARRFDPETAGSTAQPSGLYYYRARMYSPTWGRFLEPDPIGFAGGANLYAYTNNDPLDNTDPYGTDTLSVGFSGVVAIPIPFLPALSLNVLGGVGVVVDTKGNVAFYSYYGGGGGTGVAGGIGLNIQASNAATIASIAGPFVGAGGHAGAGVGGSVEVFTGYGANKEPVTGASITAGLQGGAAVTASVTNTLLTPSANVIGIISSLLPATRSAELPAPSGASTSTSPAAIAVSSPK